MYSFVRIFCAKLDIFRIPAKIIENLTPNVSNWIKKWQEILTQLDKSRHENC
jgi:hypothetical protein